MAGKVVVSTLNDDTGVLATQNGMTGIAKAWVNFDGTGTVAIRDSFNVSSITDNGTGNYTVNFTTAMPNANYSWAGTAGNTTNNAPFVNTAFNNALYSTTQLTVQCWQYNGVDTDCSIVNVAVFSS
jgi:hypothetical protein